MTDSMTAATTSMDALTTPATLTASATAPAKLPTIGPETIEWLRAYRARLHSERR